MDERPHIWSICVHGSTRNGKTQSDTVHCRGRQNQLPRHSRHPNSRNAGGKNALQQHNLYEGCTLHDNGHLQFLLCDTFTSPKFIQLKLNDIPDEVIKEYKLKAKATQNGSIYVRAKRGMCGLPQSCPLAKELYEKRLNKHGYR